MLNYLILNYVLIMTVIETLFILLCVLKCVPVLTFPVSQSFNDERKYSLIEERSAKKIASSLFPGAFSFSKVGDVFQKSSKKLQRMPPRNYDKPVLLSSLHDRKDQKINPTTIDLDLLEQKRTSTNNQIIFENKLTTQELEESLTYFTNELDDLRSSTTKANVYQNQETAKPPVKLLQKLLRDYLPVTNRKVKKPKPMVKNPVVLPLGSKKQKPAVSIKVPQSGEGQFFSLLNTLNVILNRNRLPPSETYKPSKVTTHNVSFSKITPSAGGHLWKPPVLNYTSTPDNLTKTSYSSPSDEFSMKYTKTTPHNEWGLMNDSTTIKRQQISSTPPKKFESSPISSTFLDFETSSPRTRHTVTSVSTEVNDGNKFHPNEIISASYVPTIIFDSGTSLSFEDENFSSVKPPNEANEIKDSENGVSTGFDQNENQLILTTAPPGNNSTSAALKSTDDVESLYTATSSTAKTEETTKHVGDHSFHEDSSLMNNATANDNELSTSDFATEQLTSIHTYRDDHTSSQFENFSDNGDTVYPTQQPESTIVQENVVHSTQQPVTFSLFENTLDTTNLLEYETSTKKDSTAFESMHSDGNAVLETSSFGGGYSLDDQNVSDESWSHSNIAILHPTHTGVFKELADSTTQSLIHTFDSGGATHFTQRIKYPVVHEHGYPDKIVFETSTLVSKLTVGTTESTEHDVIYEQDCSDEITFETSTSLNELTVGTTESPENDVIYEQDYSDEIIFETSTSLNKLTVGATESNEHTMIYEQDYSDEINVETSTSLNELTVGTTESTDHDVIIFEMSTRLNDLTVGGQSTSDGVSAMITDHTESFESEITHLLKDTNSVNEGTPIITQLPRQTTTHDLSTALTRHQTSFDENFKKTTTNVQNEKREPSRTIVTAEPNKIHHVEEVTDGEQQLQYNLVFEGTSDGIHPCTDVESQEPTTDTREGPLRITDTTVRFDQTVVDESWIRAGAFDTTQSQDLVSYISKSTIGTAGFENSKLLNKNPIVSNEPPEDYNQNEDAVPTSTVSCTPDSQTEGFTTWTDLETKNDESSTDTQLHKTTSESYFDTVHNLLQSSTDRSTIFSVLGSTDHVTEEESLGLFLGNEPTAETTEKEFTTLFTTLSDTSAADFMVTQTTEKFQFTDAEEEEVEDPFDCMTQSSLGTSTIGMTLQPTLKSRSGSDEILHVTPASISSTLLEKIPAREPLVQDENTVPGVFNTLKKMSTKSLDSTTKSSQTEETSNLNEILTQPGIPKDYFVQKWNLSMKNYTYDWEKPKVIQASGSLPTSKNRAEKFLNLLSGELFIEGADSEENNEGEDDAYEVDESGMKIVKSGQRRGKWIENMSNDELMALIDSVKLKHTRRS